MHKKNKMKAIVTFVVALAFILPTSAMFANSSDPQTLATTMVSVVPATKVVENGETFDLYVYIEPGEPIAGVAIDYIYFDQTLLQVDAVVLEGFFDPNPTMGSAGTIDNINGEITGIYEFTTDASSVTAANNFLKITFTADATNLGTSAIDLEGVLITDSSANPVPIAVSDGEVIVGDAIFYTLDISIVGNGATDPVPGTYSYMVDTVVDLEAIHDLGWSFDHWDGDVADPNSAMTNITMDANKTVTAYFTEEDCCILTVSTVGNGTVDVVPDKECYLYGEEPELTAVADPGWTFDSWSGDLSGNTNPTTIFMDGNKDITATFTEDHYILNISTIGNGTVDVVPDKPYYLYGETPELTAVPDSEDWTFNEWSGDLTGSDNPETIIMDGDKDVTATFTEEDTIPPTTEIILDGTMGENDWYVSAVTVTLVATDEGSGVESTWYRLDGGYWKIYAGGSFPVSTEGYHTVEAYSFDRAGNKEDTKTAVIKIDTKPPVITHEFDGVIGDEGWFVSDVTVMISAEDVTSGVNYTMYKINSGIWINYTEPFNVAENGTYVLSYYSVDFAGNVETSEVEFKIEHDTVPPVTTHEFDGIIGDNDWFTSNVVVVLTAEDNSAGVDYTMYKLDDDTEWQLYTGPILVTEDGEHTIEYYSVDKVGNKENDSDPFGFKIDQTLPTIELTWDGENSKLVADVADEKSGVAKVEFYVNGEYIGEATDDPYEYEVTNPKRGDKAQAIVFDNEGNEAISEEIDAVPQGTSQSQSSSSTSTPLSWLFGLW